MPKFVIHGSLSDEDTYFCHHLVTRIKAVSPEDVSIEYSIYPEVDYLRNMEKIRQVFGGQYHAHTALHLVIKDNEYLGDVKALVQMASKDFNIRDASIASRAVFSRQVREETAKIMNKDRDYVTMEFSDDSNLLGKVVIEMFTDLCPKACEHFVALCAGPVTKKQTGESYSYEKCPIHRIVKDGWFQCGDVVDGSGANSIVVLSHNRDDGSSSTTSSSSSSPYLPDESFTGDFGFQLGGIVGLSNTGPHTNGSQFFITLGPCEWMNNKYEGIGRVLSGYKTLQTINNSRTSSTQRPEPNIIIKYCGIEHYHSSGNKV